MRITVVDAFTDTPFTGNPAAVMVLETDADPLWMQAVAAEMNLSETAFLRQGDGGVWGLRWFTPLVEVDLCGHATLASAHVLWTEGFAAPGEPLRFSTRSGILTATSTGDAITLDFPAEVAKPADEPPGLAGALGHKPRWVGRNRFDLLVELDSEEAVRSLVPDLAALAAIPVRGTIVTASASERSADYDFVSRFFAPGGGVPEDPVTGSAHCALGPFWAERLGKDALRGRQVSRRGGTVDVEVRGDRVALTGTAITILDATMRI